MCDITAVVVQTRLRGIYKGFPTKNFLYLKLKNKRIFVATMRLFKASFTFGERGRLAFNF